MIGLVGALLGASAALVGKWIDGHYARKAERRQRAGDLLAQFWEVTDRMWRLCRRAAELEHWTTHPVDESPAPDEPSVSEATIADFHAQLAGVRSRLEEANIEAGGLLGRMRLLNLPTAEAAKALRVGSAHFDGAKSIKKREQALAAYEEAASRLMTP